MPKTPDLQAHKVLPVTTELGVGGVNLRQDLDAETRPLWHHRRPEGFSGPTQWGCGCAHWNSMQKRKHHALDAAEVFFLTAFNSFLSFLIFFLIFLI